MYMYVLICTYKLLSSNFTLYTSKQSFLTKLDDQTVPFGVCIHDLMLVFILFKLI